MFSAHHTCVSSPSDGAPTLYGGRSIPDQDSFEESVHAGCMQCDSSVTYCSLFTTYTGIIHDCILGLVLQLRVVCLESNVRTGRVSSVLLN